MKYVVRTALAVCFSPLWLVAAWSLSDLQSARDRQDMAAIERIIRENQEAVQKSNSAEALYKLALAYSYGAEVAMEMRDKKKSESLAQSGLDPARKAVDLDRKNAEYHRLLGELCGQVIPANPLFGSLKYGNCAHDEIDKALQLDPNLALAYVSRGVGNYYLPQSMGGGVDLAISDFDKAIAINPKLADAYLWKGIALRKANRHADARIALERAIQLDPNRAWAKEQLSKTPAS